MRKPDIWTLLSLLVIFVVALMWWWEASAASSDYRFTHYRIINNTKICLYEDDRGNVLTITVDQRDMCPARL